MSIKFHKVSTLPGVLEADSFYFVENVGAGHESFAESYVTNSSGVAKSIGNSAMIEQLITEKIAGMIVPGMDLQFAADITERDLLIANTEIRLMVMVLDATGDSTVASGAAMYAYDYDGFEADTDPGKSRADYTYKIAEYESLDVVVNWTDVVGRPNKSAVEIETAVNQSHTHTNSAVLDALTEDLVTGSLLYKGEQVGSTWTDNDW